MKALTAWDVAGDASEHGGSVAGVSGSWHPLNRMRDVPVYGRQYSSSRNAAVRLRAAFGELDPGVQWYLGKLAGNSSSTTVANTSGNQGAFGGAGAGLGAADSLFYSFVSNNLQVALHALETNGRMQVLSASRLVVMNSQQAQIQVGDNIPISQTKVNTSNSDTTLSSVEYVQTGVILEVLSRINPGGLVYMDVQQQVSDADTSNITTTQPNLRISTRSVSTQIACKAGRPCCWAG